MPKKARTSTDALTESVQQSNDDESSLSELEMITSDAEDEQGNEVSEQDKRAADDLAKRKKKQNEEFLNKLNHIRKNPGLWEHEDNKFLREFVNHIECNRGDFPCLPGDSGYAKVVKTSKAQQQLTKGYIKAIAEYRDTGFAEHPILYVLSRETFHEEQTFHGFSNKPAPPTKLTHLRLVDGDGNQMMGRLATEIADQGKQLKEGDVIRLDLYTELTHLLNDKTSKMPFVFIHKYSPLAFRNKPPVDEVYDPISCASVLPLEALPPQKNSSAPDRSDAPVNCCSSSRYCSMHGVNFICCVCESIPVEKLDLAAIKEDCYFATDKLDEMTNPHKRNMIYWWYATNIYSICGKGKRKELPKCLVHRIRQCHPSDEYSGFEVSCEMHNE